MFNFNCIHYKSACKNQYSTKQCQRCTTHIIIHNIIIYHYHDDTVQILNISIQMLNHHDRCWDLNTSDFYNIAAILKAVTLYGSDSALSLSDL